MEYELPSCVETSSTGAHSAADQRHSCSLLQTDRAEVAQRTVDTDLSSSSHQFTLGIPGHQGIDPQRLGPYKALKGLIRLKGWCHLWQIRL